MFLGQHTAAIDDKGRVVLPATFKKAMVDLANEQIVLQMDPFEKCLRIYPLNSFVKEKDAMVSGLDPKNAIDSKERIRFFRNVMNVSIAENGRINIPGSYINYGEIKRGVVFVGMDDFIMLWSEEIYNSWDNENLSYTELLNKKDCKPE